MKQEVKERTRGLNKNYCFETPTMKTYINTLVKNGVEYSHIIKAFSYSEALEINRKHKRALSKGEIIKGRLTRLE